MTARIGTFAMRPLRPARSKNYGCLARDIGARERARPPRFIAPILPSPRRSTQFRIHHRLILVECQISAGRFAPDARGGVPRRRR